MIREKQIVSIHFMSNSVFVGWELTSEPGWDGKGSDDQGLSGETCWNSREIVSQACIAAVTETLMCPQGSQGTQGAEGHLSPLQGHFRNNPHSWSAPNSPGICVFPVCLQDLHIFASNSLECLLLSMQVQSSSAVH